MTTCEFCGGTGEVEVVGDSVTDVFDKCGGTGFCEMRMGDGCTLGSPCPHQKPLTNEEYIKSLNTEQLAEWISKVTIDAWFRQVNNELPKPNGAKEWAEWLKQPHEE
jgi:hypothetical protein